MRVCFLNEPQRISPRTFQVLRDEVKERHSSSVHGDAVGRDGSSTRKGRHKMVQEDVGMFMV